MSETIATDQPVHGRDLSELLKTPSRSLTASELSNLDEFMSFKNHGESARNVSIADGVRDAVANLDRYCGFVEA
jgi:hypothetical protein